MMKTILLAPDSFKDSMTAFDACLAMETGLKRVFGNHVIYQQMPMSDGGEGLVDTLVTATNGQKVTVTVEGPLPSMQVTSYYGLLGDGETAVIEMAKASGLELLTISQRNPLLTSTFGTGQLIQAALAHGIRRFIIGIGGSATNDGGTGMAEALGVKFYDKYGSQLKMRGDTLTRIAAIDLSGLDKRLMESTIDVACDVDNPLLGPTGATAIFSKQKGADQLMQVQLEQGLSNLAELATEISQQEFHLVPGSGAAGGLGFGLQLFCGGLLVSGVERVIEELDLVKAIAKVDLIFTGEGSLDSQTSYGKVISGLAKVAKAQKKPLIACVGRIDGNVRPLYLQGVTAAFSILPKLDSLNHCLEQGPDNLAATCEAIGRLLSIKTTYPH